MARDYPARPKRSDHRRAEHPDDGGGQKRRDQTPKLFRLFIAADIPPEAVEQLVGWQQQYLAAERALRLTPAGQLHITLVFLGQMGEAERDLAASEVRGLEGERAFDAALTGLVGLPRRRQPRVVAAVVEEPAGTVALIQSKLAGALVEKKLYQQEKRPYFPHVTVARARGRVRLDVSEIHPDPIQFTAVRITLYNSVLKPEGALHEPLETVRLI